MGEPNTTIANIGDLAKPVDTLITKFADATGAVFRPWQIKREAKAEADAETIKALASLERDSLLRRTAERLAAEETKKQENAETVFNKALPHIADDAEPEALSDDWLLKFFDESKFISEDAMQELWAKLLAGEVNNPGTFSKRTLTALAAMTPAEAVNFVKVSNFSWVRDDGLIIVFIYEPEDEIFTASGIDHNLLYDLEDAGLIRFTEGEGSQTYHLAEEGNNGVLEYQDGTLVSIDLNEEEFFFTGQVWLTSVGEELTSICIREPFEGFVEYCERQWVQLNYKVTRIA